VKIPLRVGCPIRISTDQSLLAAPHGFSQRATSFIASWCQGIHRMPFSYSIQCSQAEASKHTMHRNHPQAVIPTDRFRTSPLEAAPKPRRSFRQEPFFAHNRIPSSHRFTHCSRNGQNRQPDKIVHTPLNSRRRPLGRLSRRTALPVRHATERRDPHQSKRINADHTRPETHQNLIHPDKEQNTRQTTHRHASRLAHHLTDLGYSTIRRPLLLPEGTWWRRSGSNR
jgi:hypothetical protein